MGSKFGDLRWSPLNRGCRFIYGVRSIQLVSLYFQLPLFPVIICVIHLPFFSIQPCKWSLHTRRKCCRPEFPTNYRLEIRTISVIRTSSDLLYLHFELLAERTDLGRDICLHECEATVSTSNFETHVENRKKSLSTAKIPKLLSQARRIPVYSSKTDKKRSIFRANSVVLENLNPRQPWDDKRQQT